MNIVMSRNHAIGSLMAQLENANQDLFSMSQTNWFSEDERRAMVGFIGKISKVHENLMLMKEKGK